MTLSFKVDPRIKKALEDLAAKENRSLSNYVVTLILNHLKEKGIPWHDDEEQKKKPKQAPI